MKEKERTNRRQQRQQQQQSTKYHSLEFDIEQTPEQQTRSKKSSFTKLFRQTMAATNIKSTQRIPDCESNYWMTILLQPIRVQL